MVSISSNDEGIVTSDIEPSLQHTNRLDSVDASPPPPSHPPLFHSMYATGPGAVT